MFSGVSRIASIFNPSKALRRSAGSDAANASRCAAARSRTFRRVATSLINTKSHGWLNPTLGARCADSSTLVSTSSATGRSRNPRRTSRRSANTRCTTSRSPTAYPGAAVAASSGNRPTATVARADTCFGTTSSAPLSITAASATLAVPARWSTWSLGVGTDCWESSSLVAVKSEAPREATSRWRPGSASLPSTVATSVTTAGSKPVSAASTRSRSSRYDVPDRRPMPRTRLTSPTPHAPVRPPRTWPVRRGSPSNAGGDRRRGSARGRSPPGPSADTRRR